MEKNKNRFISALQKIDRRGVNELISYLDSTDFFQAPASAKYHNSVEGGLLAHSLNVMDQAFALYPTFEQNAIVLDKKSIALVSLLHDVCKIGYYVIGEEWDKEWKDKTNEWRKKEVYKVEEQLPIGHGEKSIFLINRHIELTIEEAAAIRWHSGAWEAGVHFFYPSGEPFRKSLERFPLLKLLMVADQLAECFESNEKV